MHPLPGILSLLIGIAGWYYLFYSKAAHRLGAIEDALTNQRRLRLRRANGVAMLLLGGFFYAGACAVDAKTSAAAFVAVWMMVFLLLVLIVMLAYLDIRLTSRLRRRR